ncbi:Homoserine O-acetyltransferase [Corynebacterium bovis DSM 20582 = CIP 54.80]|uniref:Homoserine O-acetyltransferase n=1 Tax=Corynebacterium bovis DSM 20582 = CIP 54.80 TaxID=927655 RepID=A0A8H9YA78_9CORY|nr:homoserine O-acetyltransferase [Corynebacterium bovis DSM 20582 = CIP 54.80]WJY77023.1 Homoserine O-acetyltransferase [Corynebacterium bovis DSM 20582 = CIP 54.80]
MPLRTALLPPSGASTTVPLGTFRTEAGVDVPEAALRLFAWYDGPTAPHERPVLLVEHALTGDGDAADWWGDVLGPGRAIDTTRYLVLCANVLGGCHGSTGPSSPHPDGGYWGSRFPGISIRDMVAAEHRLLTGVLGVERVRAVIGASMGGARTLEWSLMHPEVVETALPVAVSARASAWQIGIQSSQIRFIEADPCWQGGDYHGTGRSPRHGLGQARRIAHLTYRGELELDERFSTDPQPGEDPYGPYRSRDQRFAVESYLDRQAEKLEERFDAGSYVTLTDALNRHDVGRGRGGMNAALGASQVPTTVVGVDTDILYPYHQQEHLSRNLGDFIGLSRITSPTGHDGFLTEGRQMDMVLRRHLGKAEIIAAR